MASNAAPEPGPGDSDGSDAGVSPADDCTFSMLAGPSDVPFLEQILRHLLRTCAHDFREVIIVIDDLPRAGRAPGAVQDLRTLLARLQHDGVVSRMVPLSAVDDRQRICDKHFGGLPPRDRDRRGIPILGWIAGIEAARTDFVTHFDSDILLHQADGHRWITDGMNLMRRDSSAMFVAPRPGPPTRDGTLRGQLVTPTLDSEGNLRFKRFSSRRFLVSKRRLEALLPTPLLYTSRRDRLLMQLGFGNALKLWEDCVDAQLQRSPYYRVHLESPRAWTLHCKDHGPAWLAALPAIISRIESGEFPEGQAGHYDLRLTEWL